MSDNTEDDFDLDDDGFDGFDDDPTSEGQTLGSMVQSNPLVKIGILFGIIAVIFALVLFFGGDSQEDAFSLVVGGSNVTSVPGTSENITPAYSDAIQDVNEQNLEEAQLTGGSVLPIPTNTARGQVQPAEDEEPKQDPLQRWRQLQEERLQRELQNSNVIAPTDLPQNNAHAESVQQLAGIMAAQMQSILDRESANEVQIRNITNPDLLEILAEKEREGLESEVVGDDDSGFGEENLTEEIVIPAGEIEYAQLLIEANSDNPGPVIAQIVSGPLSGSKLIGDFATTEDLITLNFNRVIVDGIDYGITAVALDPETALPGLATEIDRRYFQRIVLPIASAFIEGVATAIAETGRTEVIQEGDSVAEQTVEADFTEQMAAGIEEAGGELRTIVEEMNEDVEPLIIVESGTPMGILFLQAVTQPVEPNDF